tara:strand:- start:554 stop:1351 length:798 start_codon:yes stop_codon:yes gene_type:complete
MKIKKYIVIGNPIEHSLSPKLHNFWLKKNGINAIYEKRKIQEFDIKSIISDLKIGKINGVNVTVPFKNAVIPFMDQLSPEAIESQSVNTICVENEKIIGHNTDIAGFELGLRHTKYDFKNKKVFILGAGGVVPSIILGLKKIGVADILLSNRTKEKANELKKIFPHLKIVDWGKTPEFEVIINATSIGLKKDDLINLDYKNIGSKKFFYDIIYNPRETNFLKRGNELKNRTENGKMMFIYQAHQAFTIWHKIMPVIDDKTIELLD